MTTLEIRILAYLDQHGGKARRHDIVADLASPDSRIGRGISNGSNGAVPLIFGRWVKRLVGLGLVKQRSTLAGFYEYHEITDEGRRRLRANT